MLCPAFERYPVICASMMAQTHQDWAPTWYMTAQPSLNLSQPSPKTRESALHLLTPAARTTGTTSVKAFWLRS